MDLVITDAGSPVGDFQTARVFPKALMLPLSRDFSPSDAERFYYLNGMRYLTISRLKWLLLFRGLLSIVSESFQSSLSSILKSFPHLIHPFNFHVSQCCLI